MITPKFLQSCTDEQINKGVAWCEAKRLINSDCSDQHLNGDQQATIILISVVSGWNNYCTDPNDACPIILENKIDIRHNYEYIGSNTALIGDDEDYLFWASGKNTIRNAMEVYILMSTKS